MTRVLVTGAGGFVGRHALLPLLERGAEVHAVSRRRHPGTSGVQWHATDLLDREARAALIREVRPSHLLHFAWYAEHGKFWEAEENEAWLSATLDLADQFVRHGGQRFVGAGTCAEYDWNGLAAPCREDETAIAPATRYGRAKANCAADLAMRTDLSFAWGRIFFGFGPDEDERRLVPSVIRSLLRGDEARIGPGTGIRDFAPIRQVARGFVELLMAEAVGAINVATGQGTTIAALARRIGERMGRPELVRIGALPARAGEPDMIVADMTRSHREVGPRPMFDLDAELDETVDWWRSHETAKVSA